MVDAYIAQENFAIYPRVILSQKVCEGRIVSVDSDRTMPKDDDEYYYVDSLHRYLQVYEKEYEEYIDSEQYLYLHLILNIEKQLNGYSERRVRDKYVWLKNAIDSAIDYDKKMTKVFIKQLF